MVSLKKKITLFEYDLQEAKTGLGQAQSVKLKAEQEVGDSILACAALSDRALAIFLTD